jgi:integrase
MMLKLSDWLDRWIADRDVAESTLQKNKYHVPHINEGMGHLELERIGFRDCENLYKSLSDDLADSTVKSISGTLSAALQEAKRRGLIDTNPARDAKTPTVEQSEISVIDKGEARQLTEKLRVWSPYDTAIFLALNTGMRKSELLGLRWRNVDLYNRSLSVLDTIVKQPDGDVVESSPKTDSSRRAIGLSPRTVEWLKDHKKQHEPNEFVCERDNGDHLYHRNLSNKLEAKVRQSGVTEITFHELRHSHATILLGMGKHPKKVQERLGHSDISTTLNLYSHVSPTMQKEMAEDFDEIYE